MNSVLIQSPANATGEELRQILLAALGGHQDSDTLVWHDSTTVVIPASGTAPGTGASAGKQICQLLYAGTQAQIESDLQNAGLQPHQVVGFQSFKDEYQGDDVNGDPIYAPTVSTSIEAGTLQYLNKRYEADEVTEKAKNVNWFPVYSGQADWVAT